MGDATVVTKMTERLAEENVVLTVSNGSTYVSRLSSVVGVNATFTSSNVVSSSPIQTAISGRTITFWCTGCSSKNVFMNIRGYL